MAFRKDAIRIRQAFFAGAQGFGRLLRGAPPVWPTAVHIC
jgi:hypothetical protein